jgi:hypothetical protein
MKSNNSNKVILFQKNPGFNTITFEIEKPDEETANKGFYPESVREGVALCRDSAFPRSSFAIMNCTNEFRWTLDFLYKDHQFVQFVMSSLLPATSHFYSYVILDNAHFSEFVKIICQVALEKNFTKLILSSKIKKMLRFTLNNRKLFESLEKLRPKELSAELEDLNNKKVRVLVLNEMKHYSGFWSLELEKKDPKFFAEIRRQGKRHGRDYLAY